MFDARGTLGIDREAKVGVQEVVVTAVVDTDGDDKALERLARSTERYCVVAQSLREPVRFDIRRASEPSASTDAPHMH
jgi:organic hydroperoxide reductase OsmC/OhrA